MSRNAVSMFLEGTPAHRAEMQRILLRHLRLLPGVARLDTSWPRRLEDSKIARMHDVLVSSIWSPTWTASFPDRSGRRTAANVVYLIATEAEATALRPLALESVLHCETRVGGTDIRFFTAQHVAKINVERETLLHDHLDHRPSGHISMIVTEAACMDPVGGAKMRDVKARAVDRGIPPAEAIRTILHLIATCQFVTDRNADLDDDLVLRHWTELL